MKKKKIQKLVGQSYKGPQLDPKAVEMIADHMNRQTLKQYIHTLKQNEKKKQIMITSPKSLSESDKKALRELFPDKQFMYILDPEMINGIQIIDDDRKYEINLNKTFHDIINHLSRYD